jgi:hypothetical protein
MKIKMVTVSLKKEEHRHHNMLTWLPWVWVTQKSLMKCNQKQTSLLQLCIIEPMHRCQFNIHIIYLYSIGGTHVLMVSILQFYIN